MQNNKISILEFLVFWFAVWLSTLILAFGRVLPGPL